MTSGICKTTQNKDKARGICKTTHNKDMARGIYTIGHGHNKEKAGELKTLEAR